MNNYYNAWLLTAFSAIGCAVLVAAWLVLVALVVGLL